MILPITWLKQYVDVNEAIEQIAERYISLGFEAEVLDNDRLDLEITPNRGDLLSIIGLAREYAASTDQTIKMPLTKTLSWTDALTGYQIERESAAFHRISAVTIKNLTVKESPEWLKKALQSMGSESINCVVDVTNYVMFELGIPLHAFDLRGIIDHQAKIRLSHKDETFTSLKGEVRALPSGYLVVESGGELIDLIGIRGGKSSMILPDTTGILLWAASLPRPAIRQASKTLQIRTEAGYRHERETDWQMVPVALARATDLIIQLSGGEESSAVDWQHTPLDIKPIEFEPSLVGQILGQEFSDLTIKKSLEQLGFTLNGWQVTPPSWRAFDIHYPQDLVEEVARLHGYNQLNRTVIEKTNTVSGTVYHGIESLKDSLVEAGWTETYTESFSGTREAKLVAQPEAALAELANPVNRDFAYCRPAITPHLLHLLSLNNWSSDAQVFEIGTVFPNAKTEETHLAMASTILDPKLFSPWFEPDQVRKIGLDDPLSVLYKLRRPILSAERHLSDHLQDSNNLSISSIKPNYKVVSAYPPAVRDIAIIVDDALNPEDVATTIKTICGDSLILIELFDQFSSEKFGTNKQSLAYHLVFQSITNSLDNNDVDELQEKIITQLQNQYQAQLR